MSRIKKFALVFAAVAAVGGGVAHAAIPSKSTGQITACYSAANPALKVVDTEAGQACAAGETAVKWSSGWTFRGEYDGIPHYNKGDVVRISYKYNTGCTTPKGTWLALIDGASPCTERPEYWATLALDPVKGPDVHWARLNGNGTVAASSEPVTVSYRTTGSGYLHFANVTDALQCAVTATSTMFNVTPSAAPVSNALIGYATHRNGTATDLPLNVTVMCGSYS